MASNVTLSSGNSNGKYTPTEEQNPKPQVYFANSTESSARAAPSTILKVTSTEYLLGARILIVTPNF